MTFDNTVLPERMAFALRLAVGIAFGLVMAWLGHRDIAPMAAISTWHTIAYTTLLLTAFLWWAGAGAMRRWSLGIWGIVASLIVAGLASHQVDIHKGNATLAFLSPAGWLVVPLLFITHELVSSGDRAGRLVAPYATYFDQAWKHGVQLALALLFTGLFWIILWLGAALLGFIGFHWLKDLLLTEWIALPLTGAAMACGVQLGDVQDKILVNVRALVLSVLSWLLPVITLICLLFLGSLCVSGLAPLWKTKAASTTLLGAGVILVLLINAAYQQGDAERRVQIVMRWSARAACLLLPAFAVLAAYSLWLRIDQHGLSPERVLAGAGVMIGILFAAGYAAAAVWPGRWLAGLERVNVAMAVIESLILLALLTPAANPARLSVDDQVARLQSGRTPLDRFDWDVLRASATGRYGTDARTRLATVGKTLAIRTAAFNAAADDGEDRSASSVTPVADNLSRLKVVYPAGGTLPATFDGQALAGLRDDCARDPSKTCTVAMVDLNGDGTPEVVVRDGPSLSVFTLIADKWTLVPPITMYIDDEAVKAFDAGQVETQPHPWSDLKLGKTRLTIENR